MQFSVYRANQEGHDQGAVRGQSERVCGGAPMCLEARARRAARKSSALSARWRPESSAMTLHCRLSFPMWLKCKNHVTAMPANVASTGRFT